MPTHMEILHVQGLEIYISIIAINILNKYVCLINVGKQQ